MKVVYVKTLLDKIRAARDDAESWGKEIEYVELDPSEWAEAFRYFAPQEPCARYYMLGIEIRKAP